jgi:hypothetical protein
MSFIVTINYVDDGKAKIENVNDVSFVGEFMILCMSDLKTRLVNHLSRITEYKIVEQPVSKAKKVAKKK